MGGRGASSSRSLGAIESGVRKQEFWKNTEQFETASRVSRSKYFMSSLEDAISKEAFMRGREITIKQTRRIASKMVSSLPKK